MGTTPWITISALNQYVYCPRRCALIHQEQSFEDNIHTIQGSLYHEHVDQPAGSPDPVGVDYSLPLWSNKHRVRGIADAVEWHEGTPFPVEYKKGRRKKWVNDDVQLCAQALCLEEMMSCIVPKGAVFHVSSRHRRDVVFDESLRVTTKNTIRAVQKLISAFELPERITHREKCLECSMRDICLPELNVHRVVPPDYFDKGVP